MTEWLRFPVEVTCGLCSVRLEPGAPVHVIVGPSWRKLRCEGCAGSQAPTTWDEPVPERLRLDSSTWARLRELGQRAQRDYKLAQGGETT